MYHFLCTTSSPHYHFQTVRQWSHAAFTMLAFAAMWPAVMGLTLPAALNLELISREQQTWRGSSVDAADCVQLKGNGAWLLEGKSYGDSLKPYKSLFAKWNNKDVVFAGDSLMRQVWLTFGCAANLLNGTTETSMLEELHQTRDGVTVHAIPQPSPFKYDDCALTETAYTGIAMLHGKMHVFVDGMSFNLHFYFHYNSLGQKAYQEQYDKFPAQMGSSGPLLLVIINTALVSTLNKYDLVYLNTGHGAFHSTYSGEQYWHHGLKPTQDEGQEACQDHFKGLFDLFKKSNKHVSFIEHPPSHFATADGDLDNAGSGVCMCQPLETLKKQFNYQCERGQWMDAYLKDNIQTANYFESMSDLCDRHYQSKEGDCRHFDQDPVLLITLVENMLQLL